jgi:hypothetical protein
VLKPQWCLNPGIYGSPFKVMLLLRKVVRFWNFLRTWIPRRLSLVGANTSNKMGRFQTQILVNQKKKFLVEGTRNLAFTGATFSFSLVFFFSSFSRPLLVATDHLPWPSSFLSHLPLFWRQTSPGRLNDFHVRALVCSSSEQKSFAFLTWATRRTKKTQRRIL